MKRFVEVLSEYISENVTSTLTNTSATEHRRVFRGPCMPLLEEVLGRFEAQGGIPARLASAEDVVVPVLLPVAESGGPPLGRSGKCSPSHVVQVRNTSSARFTLFLLPPGGHLNESILSAADEFGVAQQAHDGTSSIEDWLSDPFVMHLRDVVAQRLSLGEEGERREFAALFDVAAKGAEEVENHDVERKWPWAVLSRLFDIPVGSPDSRMLACLALGVPPMAGSRLKCADQIAVIRRLGSEFSEDGMREVFRVLGEEADPETQASLKACLADLETRLVQPIQFLRAPTAYYVGSRAWELPPAPPWWKGLTVEKWLAALEEEREPDEAIALACTNSIVSRGRGVNAVVLDRVELRALLPEGEKGPVAATLSRQASGQGGNRSWDLRIGDVATCSDDSLPAHRAPVRYSVDAPGFQPRSLRIISLATWAPGVSCEARTALKVRVPKAAKAKSGIAFDTELHLDGSGRHYVDAYVAPGVELGEKAEYADSDGQRVPENDTRVSRVSDHQFGFEVESGGDCSYSVELRRGVQDPVRIRVNVSCAEATPEGCSSEFERLIRLNRSGGKGKATAEVQVSRVHRSTDLQAWCLAASSVGVSHLPLVLGPDLERRWRRPTWQDQDDGIFSEGRFLFDPRPSPQEFSPPDGFLASRAKIAEAIRGEGGDGLVEGARLGEWAVTDPDFLAAVSKYLSSYAIWLEKDPRVAAWVDLCAVHALERDGSTLQRIPEAILLSPLHPVRLGWHVAAQRALWEAHRKREDCPAASILDPRSVPDVLFLPLRSAAEGITSVPFFAVDHDSDYWGVLWNSGRLDAIAEWAGRAPFDRAFGIQIGGVTSGFSVSQVERAMDDVSEMLAAKPTLNVLVTGTKGQSNACNEGLIGWGRTRIPSAERAASGSTRDGERSGPRLVQILDRRPTAARPDDADIANLAEDTGNSVRWLDAKAADRVRPDLGVIAQLESSNNAPSTSDVASPLGPGALIRHRVRRQHAAGNGAFVTESRSCGPVPGTGDAIMDGVATCICRTENMSDARAAYTFAPSVNTVVNVLDKASFAAVSSSAVDPACFLGEWLKGSYLWDYELPSYSRRAGDSNGYYLLSTVKDVDEDALASALARLPGPEEEGAKRAEEILKEVASRGIPTVRGLSAGDHGASGDLGLFVASRLLQDAFRPQGAAGILRVLEEVDGREVLNLVLPVDPFRGYLEVLQDSLGLPGTRPDLLVASFDVTSNPVRCRLTPVEVKYRGAGKAMPQKARLEALGQAQALAVLLQRLREKGQSEQILWRLTNAHLLVTMVSFGLRVYSQQRLGADPGKEWAKHHERIVSALLNDEAAVEVDKRGRLIVIDASPESKALDLDEDGFRETMVLSLSDAGTIVRDPSPAIAATIRGELRDWELWAAPAKAPDHVEAPGPAAGAGEAPPVEPRAPERDQAKTEKPPPSGNANETGDRTAPGTTPVASRPVDTPAGVVLHVGFTDGTFKPAERRLNLSDTALNQLNIGVVGDLGTGKTQLLKSLVYQLAHSADRNRGVAPRALIIDYKKDYSSDDFVRATGARVFKPKRLPLNLFAAHGPEARDDTWLHRYRFFADTLAKIYSGMGPVQMTNLKEAVRSAYAGHTGGSAPTLSDVRDAYRGKLGNKGADSPFAIIDYLCDMEVFDPNPAPGATFGSFLNGIVVVSLDDLGQDDSTKNMLVATLLNMFYEHMLSIPKRPYVGTDPQLRVVDSYLLVDEADNIMKYEFDVLRKLLLQGREFGVGVILASQYLKHFKPGATDYREPLLTWFIHKVPNISPQELGALGLTENLVELATEVKALNNHHCLFKTVGVDGEFVKGSRFIDLPGVKGAPA